MSADRCDSTCPACGAEELHEWYEFAFETPAEGDWLLPDLSPVKPGSVTTWSVRYYAECWACGWKADVSAEQPVQLPKEALHAPR